MTTKWYGDETDCTVCDEKLNRFPNKQWFIDGKMLPRAGGSWALMCARCFEMYGVGLGTGKGQKYHCVTKIKIEG